MHFINIQNKILNTRAILIFIFSVFLSATALGQNTILEQHESIDDAFIPVSRATMQTSKAYRYRSTNILTVQVNVNENGENMLGDAANEPSIAYDPTNHNNMAIGWRQFDTIASNFRQAGFGYTIDGGLNWTFPGTIEPGVFRSDPVLDSDKSGNFYYNSLTLDSSGLWCKIFSSDSHGAAWDEGTFAQGGDKTWMSVDKTGGPGSGNIYNYWSASTLCPPHQFTRSTDENLSYEECSSVLGEPGWGTTAINAEGILFIGGWQGQDSNFVVSRSSTAQYPGQVVEWDLASELVLDGKVAVFGGIDSPNPAGLIGQVVIAIDSSGTETNGNIYALCSVERYSNEDPCDVMFSQSTDEGESWSEAIRLNDDPGLDAWQWFATMSVAPDGRIDVVWLDTRNNPGTFISELYYSYSLDGGISWSVNESLSEPFNPHLGWPEQNKIGDYIHMLSNTNGAHLAWTATFNGEQDIYYSNISMSTGVQEEEISKKCLSQNYPNPFREKTSIHYEVQSHEVIIIKLTDLHGRLIKTLINRAHSPGNYQVELLSDGLNPGIYYYTILSGQIKESRKLVIIK